MGDYITASSPIVLLNSVRRNLTSIFESEETGGIDARVSASERYPMEEDCVNSIPTKSSDKRRGEENLGGNKCMVSFLLPSRSEL